MPGLTVEKQIILVCSYFDHVQLSYGLLLAGFGGKVKVGNSWGSGSLDGAELSRSPQCTRVHPGPHPTRKERPANRPASINKFPYKKKQKKHHRLLFIKVSISPTITIYTEYKARPSPERWTL